MLKRPTIRDLTFLTDLMEDWLEAARRRRGHYLRRYSSGQPDPYVYWVFHLMDHTYFAHDQSLCAMHILLYVARTDA